MCSLVIGRQAGTIGGAIVRELALDAEFETIRLQGFGAPVPAPPPA
jgi:hypothetical protein